MLPFSSRRKIYRGWRKPARFDRNLIIIGTGAGGLVSAYIGAALKARVTLIERERMGGDCLNTGCVPSKALLRTTSFLAEVKRSAALGVPVASAEVDFDAIRSRIRRVIRQIEPHDSIELYTRLGVKVREGTVRLEAPWQVINDNRSANVNELI